MYYTESNDEQVNKGYLISIVYFTSFLASKKKTLLSKKVFIPPGNTRKPKGFWYFQKVLDVNVAHKWVKSASQWLCLHFYVKKKKTLFGTIKRICPVIQLTERGYWRGFFFIIIHYYGAFSRFFVLVFVSRRDLNYTGILSRKYKADFRVSRIMSFLFKSGTVSFFSLSFIFFLVFIYLFLGTQKNKTPLYMSHHIP